MEYPVIGFIGSGHMTTSLVRGLIASHYPGSHLLVYDHHIDNTKALQSEHAIQVMTSQHALANTADVILLAVKPQALSAVCQNFDLDPLAKKNTLIISVAAGITTQTLLKWLAPVTQIIRAMPNTPCQIQQGMTGLQLASSTICPEKQKVAEQIFTSTGDIMWVENNNEMNILTALSGSGPAYFFQLFEGFINAACQLGFSKDKAIKLTLQAALGATLLAKSAPSELTTLKSKVTSKGGTTEAGLQSLEMGGINDLLKDALRCAIARANALEQTLQ